MTDRELDKRAAHRLAVIRHAQEVTGNVSKTCRHCGITRQACYKWRRRYEAGLDHRVARRLVGAPHEPSGDQRRCGRQGRLPAPDLPPRAAQDRDVPHCARRLGLRCDRPSSVAQVLYTTDGLQYDPCDRYHAWSC